LARAAEAVSSDDIALVNYGKAIEKARANETIDGVPLAGAARNQKFRLLVRRASSARKSRNLAEAADLLTSAASVTRTASEQLEAQLLLAEVLESASKPRDAVAVCQKLLRDDQLRSLPVAAADGHRTVRADLLIADRLKSIVTKHGRAVYAQFEKEAVALVAQGKKEKDFRTLDQACRNYPEATVIPRALLELGVLYEQAGRLSDASQTFKRLQTAATDDDLRVLALWRLAQVYEARQLLVSARDSYLELLSRFPKKALPREVGRSGTVTELVAAELARPLYSSIVADRPEPPTPLPLFRRWQWQPKDSQPVRTIVACGVAPSLDSGRLFLLEKTSLRLLDPASGAPRWSAGLGAPAVWAGYVSDKLIVATSRQIAALETREGGVLWRYDASKTGKDARGPDPFAAAVDAPDRPEPRGPSLSAFQLAKGRVFCLRNRTELIALDADSGAIDWSFSSPPAEINSNIWIGADKALLQIDKPNQLLVLATSDGRPESRTPLEEKERLERPPLAIDENSVILVSDRNTVKRFDLRSGQTSWVYQEAKGPPVNAPPPEKPQLFGTAECLLVLYDGRTLIRLDPATGNKRWQSLLGAEDLSERPGSIACDQKNFYCVNFENISGAVRQCLRAVALEDGSRLWSCPLSGPQDAVWSIALSERSIFAYPSATRYSDAGDSSSMPVIVHRRDDGALIERFVFQTSISSVTFKVGPRGAFLATSKGIWALSSKSD
jgi:outer membrane protein assembly factor BamB/tetratricopeptide (TPR) repeat protein